MRFGYADTCLAHDTGPRHPESADRLRAIRRRLSRVHGAPFTDPEPSDRAAITAVHDATYVDELDEFCAAGGGAWDSDTVMAEESWDAALASAGLAQWAAATAVPSADASDIPFAIGRPPGHHATAADAMGFCLFNNVAVAAQSVLDEDEARTVAIIDWDVHHGNGTQDIFVDRADVAYASIHEEGLYPGTGAIDETGIGAGDGRTLNVPLTPGAQTATYLAVITDVISPWLETIGPDLMLVSAGFDSHRHDPISRMAVTTDGYGTMTEQLLSIAADLDALVGFVLEGGYGLDTLADGVATVHEVCSGYEPSSPDGVVRDIDRERIATARSNHGLGS